MRRVLLVCCLAVTGCGSDADTASNSSGRSNVVVLNAPVSGIVRRVLVGEGVTVRDGAPVIEIETDAPPAAPGDAVAEREARRRAHAAAGQNAGRAMQEEVERAAIEVQRMESLVAQNAAPQAQLDAARAVYQRAQERQQGRGASGAPTALPAQDLQPASPANTAAPPSVFVRATSAGSVRVVSVRAGQRVEMGQPVATLVPDAR